LTTERKSQIRSLITPGIIISLVSGIFAAGGSWAVSNYKTDTNSVTLADVKKENAVNLTEVKNLITNNNNTMAERINKLDDRLNQMVADGRQISRLEATNNELEKRLGEIRGDLKSSNEVQQARWDNITTRMGKLERQ
jgi:hypothetical protein